MSDLYNDGNIAAWFVPAIADISAPKAATEVGAVGALALHTRMTQDGLKVGLSEDAINSSKMMGTWDTEQPGRSKANISIKYVRGDAVGDKSFETTLVYGAAGFLVVRRNVADSVAPAAAQSVEVYPVKCGRAMPSDPTANSMQEVTVNLRLTGVPRSFDNPATLAA